MEIEKKIWLPDSYGKEHEHKVETRFCNEFKGLCEKYGVVCLTGAYVMKHDLKKGQLLTFGSPSKAWLDAAWQRIRLHVSDLISKGMIK
jgi:hypothetical protein